MFAAKLFIATFLLISVNARNILNNVGTEEDVRLPEVEEDQDYERYLHPAVHGYRVRRQAQGSLTLNGDGSAGIAGKIPLAGNDQNVLSAVGRADFDNKLNLASKGFGLAVDNVNGHGLTVMKENLPGFGSKLTGAGHATLFHNSDHDIGANAFVTRNMPTIPHVPNFNTVGGGLDYTYKNTVGASLGMAHTPFLDRKDYSAMGNLNLFRNPTSSVDFSAGFKKFDTPFMSSGWKPNFGLSFGRSF